MRIHRHDDEKPRPSETEISRSGSNPERRTKRAGETLKRMFKSAVKAVTRRETDASPPPKTRRRGGEKAGGAPILLRRFRRTGKPTACGRYAVLQPMREGSPPENVLHAESGWDVFDITGLAYAHGIENGSSAQFDARSDHLSPGP
jgi:hypothetical protein